MTSLRLILRYHVYPLCDGSGHCETGGPGITRKNFDYIMAGVTRAEAQLKFMREWGGGRMYTALRQACATPVSIDVLNFKRQAIKTRMLCNRSSSGAGNSSGRNWSSPTTSLFMPCVARVYGLSMDTGRWFARRLQQTFPRSDIVIRW